MRRIGLVLAGLLALLLGAAALVWQLGVGDDATDTAASSPVDAQDARNRGAYLARAGNCLGCHTRRGGAPYAGGRAIETPFGTVYSSNLTPDAPTGIGHWSAQDFWRAVHHGRSRDGRLLAPAFPYTSTTRITRADSDALYAWLMSQPPVAQANREPALRWPFGTQAALAFWRALYFRPGVQASDPSQSAQWNRGAYLVQGLAHCAECHGARNALGALKAGGAGGGQLALQEGYAPSLHDRAEAGVADWPLAEIVAFLKTGQSARGHASGPMAEVVLQSTQHQSDADLQAMATYLKALPQVPDAKPSAQATAKPTGAARVQRGARLYEDHCARCHGERGEGVPGAYPALAGNRAVVMAQTTNMVHAVLHGGFAPATAGNPRPFGMPPYVLVLDDADIAAVLTHLRSAWGNAAPEVTELEVNRVRAAQAR